MPADARWPRYMTCPHPAAVGSFGPSFASWSRRRSGRSLLWWQRLAAARILEHDDAGNLVWLWALLSTSRQVGKSVLVGELALWRLHQAERWNEPQLVLMTSKDVAAAREVHRGARAWARTQAGWTVRQANGQEEVASPDGSRWAVRGSGSVYSYGSSCALVDEAWGVDPGVVDDGIEPTLVARTSPQLLLTSTAHRLATPLVPGRRRLALAQVEAPDDALLLEWSSPAAADPGDVSSWRAASPHWSRRRERLIAAKHQAAVSGEPDPGTQLGQRRDRDPWESFRTQWLNVWPAVTMPSGTRRDEPFLDPGAWASLVDYGVGGPSTGCVVAVEDYFGRGAAVAVAAQQTAPGDLAAVWGRLYDTRAEAFGEVARVAAERGPCTLLVGASLDGDPLLPGDVVASVELATTASTRAALPLVRDLVARRRLVHDGHHELAAQVDGLLVTESASGGLNVSTRSARSDLVRAAAWAVSALVAREPEPLAFFVY